MAPHGIVVRGRSSARDTRRAEASETQDGLVVTASLKESLTRVALQAGGEAARTVRNVSQTVAAQVGGAASGAAEAGSDLAAAAREHAKTFASELEGMARRNPLGTLAGALLVGVVIGMMARGRS